MIMKSDAIFARKFSESKDTEIINAIYKHIKEKNAEKNYTRE